MASIHHIDWRTKLSSRLVQWFLIYLDFHISAFWLEIAYFGPKFDDLGLMGSNLIIFCVFWAIMRQYPSVWSVCKLEKKKQINKNVAKHYTSSICPETHLEWIVTKFSVWINCANLLANWFKGLDSVESTITLQVTSGVAVNSAELLCCVWWSMFEMSPTCTKHKHKLAVTSFRHSPVAAVHFRLSLCRSLSSSVDICDTLTAWRPKSLIVPAVCQSQTWSDEVSQCSSRIVSRVQWASTLSC